MRDDGGLRRTARTLRRRGRQVAVLVQMAAGPERRYASDWWHSLDRSWLVREHRPWLVFEATTHLEGLLGARPGARVFEYGSGGSTLFWLDHGADVVSIEHDTEWFGHVQASLPSGTVDYRLVPPSAGSPGADISDPGAFASDDAAFRGMSFQEYVEQIDAFADDWFDIVLVDGRSRASCLAHALPKVTPGGCVVLDNADRHYYTQQVAGLEAFDRVSYVGHAPGLEEPTRTDVFTRR